MWLQYKCQNVSAIAKWSMQCNALLSTPKKQQKNPPGNFLFLLFCVPATWLQWSSNCVTYSLSNCLTSGTRLLYINCFRLSFPLNPTKEFIFALTGQTYLDSIINLTIVPYTIDTQEVACSCLYLARLDSEDNNTSARKECRPWCIHMGLNLWPEPTKVQNRGYQWNTKWWLVTVNYF